MKSAAGAAAASSDVLERVRFDGAVSPVDVERCLWRGVTDYASWRRDSESVHQSPGNSRCFALIDVAQVLYNLAARSDGFTLHGG